MKIGIDISQIVYRGTGISEYTRNLVRELVKSTGHSFVLFGSSLRKQAELVEFFHELPAAAFTSKIYSLPQSALTFLWNQVHRIPIERFIGDVDLFHTSDWTEPPAAAPKVTTIHDLVVYKYPQHLPETIVANQKARLAWVKKESRLIIADSNSTKQDIIEYLNISPDLIHVIYLGVAEQFFPRSVDEINRVKRKYNITKDYLLSVGTREPRKNLGRTIAAFKTLHEKNVELVIAGNFGWGEDIGTKKNIRLLGLVDAVDLPGLYSGARGFVYPSLYEGFGLPVLEAMACGTPVLTSKRGSLAEIAGSVGVFVEPESVAEIAEAMEKLIALGKNERKQLAQRGMQHARSFTWEKTARETLKVYEKAREL